MNLLILLLAVSPIILALGYILLLPVIEWVQENNYSFSDHYALCQNHIKCKQAHNAGMLAGEYYSDEYKKAYRLVMGY
ncbi:hypothetical protein [Pseudoalteromonas phage PH357]|nr:hypothetical protein [Pseudoalteromonas phage PH357]